MTPADALSKLLTCATHEPCPRETYCATLAVFAMSVLKERGEWPPRPVPPKTAFDSEVPDYAPTWEARGPIFTDWSAA